MFKASIRNSKATCEICSKLTIKTPERLYWLRTYFAPGSSVSVINFKHVNAGSVVSLLANFKREVKLVPSGNKKL